MLGKAAAFVLAMIQVLLLLRLALPFVHWPSDLDAWVSKLVDATNMLAAPFQPLFKTLDLRTETGGVLTTYTNKLDAGVLVAMVGWVVIAFVVLMLISLVNRAR